jgi:hypothetical protein
VIVRLTDTNIKEAGKCEAWWADTRGIAKAVFSRREKKGGRKQRKGREK